LLHHPIKPSPKYEEEATARAKPVVLAQKSLYEQATQKAERYG
jgi:hypothetical protein